MIGLAGFWPLSGLAALTCVCGGCGKVSIVTPGSGAGGFGFDPLFGSVLRLVWGGVVVVVFAASSSSCFSSLANSSSMEAAGGVAWTSLSAASAAPAPALIPAVVATSSKSAWEFAISA